MLAGYLKLYASTFQFLHLWNSLRDNIRNALNNNPETKEYVFLSDDISDAYPYQLMEVTFVIVEKICDYLNKNNSSRHHHVDRKHSISFHYLIKAIITFYDYSSQSEHKLIESDRMDSSINSLISIIKLLLTSLTQDHEQPSYANLRYDTISFGKARTRPKLADSSHEEQLTQYIEASLLFVNTMVRLFRANRLTNSTCVKSSIAVFDQLTSLQKHLVKDFHPEQVTTQVCSHLSAAIRKLHLVIKSLGGTVPNASSEIFGGHGDSNIRMHYDDGELFQATSSTIYSDEHLPSDLLSMDSSLSSRHTFIHWPNCYHSFAIEGHASKPLSHVQCPHSQVESIVNSFADILVQEKDMQESYLGDVYANSDQPRWKCISGSGDPFVVLVNTNIHPIDSKLIGTIRVFNSSGFKIPSFVIQLQCSDQTWSNVRSMADDSSVFYHENVMKGLTYMQPNRFTDYEFFLPMTSFEDVVINCRCIFEGIEQETTDYFMSTNTATVDSVVNAARNESFMSTPSSFPQNSSGNKLVSLSSCSITFEPIVCKAARWLRPFPASFPFELMANLPYVKCLPISELSIHQTNKLHPESLHSQIVASSLFLDKEVRLLCQCATSSNHDKYTASSFEDLEWTLITPWNDVVKVSATLYDMQSDDYDFRYRNRKGSVTIRSSTEEVLQALFSDIPYFVDVLSAGILGCDIIDANVLLDNITDANIDLNESWSRDLYLFT
jgi:hypothetical protein